MRYMDFRMILTLVVVDSLQGYPQLAQGTREDPPDAIIAQTTGKGKTQANNPRMISRRCA
jgi:hypothetical protein